VSGFVRIPYDDIAAVEQVAANNPNVVAVLFEPVQGEGGIRAAHVDYIRALRRICDDRGWLLMADEVQCGVGRTGHWFAHQAAGVKVDVMALAKGLGAGVPIGACLTSGAATGVFKPGNHGSTFGGNPLACVAALTTLQVLDDDRLLQHVVTVGDVLRAELRGQLDGVTGVTDIRGVGQMTGIELDRPCGELVAQAQAKGLLINVTQERVIRLVPPLVLSAAEAKEMASILAPLIRGFLGA
jgi:acetylornithine aminotransferase